MTCPDENLLVDYAEGTLPADQLGSIDDHLDACADCRVAVAGLVRAGERDRLEPVGPGTTAGRFVVRGSLGAGGMGMVFSAHDPELDRLVALKVLRARREDATVRLVREAQAIARVNHPNVVSVFAVGTVGHHLYVAMELVKGRTLRNWLRDKPTLPEVVEVFGQAARGLAAAHRAGVVHRDFKPDNAMLTENGAVKVLDFGLAQLSDVPASDAVTPEVSGTDLQLTRSGTVVGTPAYMAPEQFHGQVEPRSDQYAFCVALFEALCGARPFSGRDLDELTEAKRRGTFSFPRRLPGPLRALLRRGLDPNPDRRWPDMDAVADALTRGRGRAVVLAVATATAAAVALSVWAATAVDTDRIEIAVVADDNAVLIAQAEAEFSEGSQLAYVGETEDGLQKIERAFELAREAGADEIAAKAATYAAVIAAQNLARPAEGERWLQHATHLVDRAGRPARSLALLDQARGKLALLSGDHEAALAAFEASLAGAEAIEDFALADALRGDVAAALANLLRQDEALIMLRKRVEDIRTHGLGDAVLLVALRELGAILHMLDRIDEALDVANEALDLAESLYPPGHIQRGHAMSGVGRTLARHGDVDGAKTHLEGALAIYEDKLGPDHYEVANALRAVAVVNLIGGDADRAEALCLRAVELLRANRGEDHPRLVGIYRVLADVARHRGDAAAAREHRSNALRVAQALGDGGAPVPTSLRVGLAGDLNRLGEHERAREILDDIASAGAKLGYAYHHERGRELLARGDRSSAADELARALDLAEAEPAAYPFIRDEIRDALATARGRRSGRPSMRSSR